MPRQHTEGTRRCGYTTNKHAPASLLLLLSGENIVLYIEQYDMPEIMIRSALQGHNHSLRASTAVAAVAIATESQPPHVSASASSSSPGGFIDHSPAGNDRHRSLSIVVVEPQEGMRLYRRQRFLIRRLILGLVCVEMHYCCWQESPDFGENGSTHHCTNDATDFLWSWLPIGENTLLCVMKLTADVITALVAAVDCLDISQDPPDPAKSNVDARVYNNVSYMRERP